MQFAARAAGKALCTVQLARPTSETKICTVQLARPTSETKICTVQLVRPTPKTKICTVQLARPAPKTKICTEKLASPAPKTKICTVQLVECNGFLVFLPARVPDTLLPLRSAFSCKGARHIMRVTHYAGGSVTSNIRKSRSRGNRQFRRRLYQIPPPDGFPRRRTDIDRPGRAPQGGARHIIS